MSKAREWAKLDYQGKFYQPKSEFIGATNTRIPRLTVDTIQKDQVPIVRITIFTPESYSIEMTEKQAVDMADWIKRYYSNDEQKVKEIDL